MKIKLAAMGLPVLLIASGCGGDGPTDPGSPEPVASVSVSPLQHQMGVGESHPFTVTLRSASGRVLTGRGVSWTSGGETVATVAASGMVTGVGEGSTEILASSEGRSGSALVQVTAAPGSDGPVTRVVVDPDTADLEEGEGTELTARTLDAEGREVIGRAVQWSTKNHEVALELFLLDVRDPEPAPARILPAGTAAVDPAPSPHGKRIAYVVATGGGSDLWLVPPVGGERVLLHLGGTQFAPAWIVR